MSPVTEDIKRGQLPKASVEHGVSLAADGNGQGKITSTLSTNSNTSCFLRRGRTLALGTATPVGLHLPSPTKRPMVIS